ncbi:MAG: lysophospholipid acyltransferase family protein [Nitrospinota bacterium]
MNASPLSRRPGKRRRSKDRSALRKRLEAQLLLAGAWLVGALPPGWGNGLARAAGGWAWKRCTSRREVTLSNLRRALGSELGEEAIERIGEQSFENLARTVVENCRLWVRGPDRVGEVVRVEGLHHVERARREGKGIIFFTAHLGNWELVALYSAHRGYPLHLVARPLDYPYLDARLSALRSRWGNRVVSKRNPLWDCVRLLRQNAALAILLDQNVLPRQGVFVDFFGRRACTSPMAAMLALRTGAACLPVFVTREPDGRHLIRVGEPIPPVRTGDVARDVVETTARFTRAIEAAIRERPGQWLWMHRRWKARPDEEVRVGGSVRRTEAGR